MKTWKIVVIAVTITLMAQMALAQSLIPTYPQRETPLPWRGAICSRLLWGSVAWIRWIKGRRRLGRALHVGDYLIAVRSIHGGRYEVRYHDYDEVIWRSEDVPRGDPWYTSAYRSSGEPAALDIIFYDENGAPEAVRFYIGTLIRSDAGIDAIMKGAGKHPVALNFKFLVDIGVSTVKLIVHSGAERAPRDDAWGGHPTLNVSGKTVWSGRRDATGQWVKKV